MTIKTLENKDKVKTVFLIGSPRSGTTILENILNCHKNIVEFYEPYYLWEKYFSCKENDIWQKKHLNNKMAREIKKEFKLYRKKAGKPVVLDKSPTHSFNIEIINKIFPEAKWIHILRDGRDATLSIKKEWDKRRKIIQQKNPFKLLKIAIDMLKRQSFWRYRLMAVFYELTSNSSINPLLYFNKARWKGKVGWGPRFLDWENYLRDHTTFEFNAMQWVKSVEAVKNSWSLLNGKNKIEIRYEDLIIQPEKSLTNILNILECEASSSFFNSIPNLKKANFNKWTTEFSEEEKNTLKPILSPLLDELNYIKQFPW
jgi:Sulfotransferase family